MSVPFAIDLTRRRFAAGSRVTGGRWSPGATTDSTIAGGWQPFDVTELLTLPEGERTRDPHWLITEDDVRILDLATVTAADHVSADASTFYEVRKIETHGDGAPLPHRECVCLRLQESTQAE